MRITRMVTTAICIILSAWVAALLWILVNGGAS